MASQHQIDANRRNAEKSTGPRSAEGKARSSLNHLKTGIDSQSLVLPGEDPATVESLRAEYYEHHQPQTPDERDTLDAVIHAVCLLRRLRRLEAELTRHEMQTTPDLDPATAYGRIFSNASLKFIYLQSRINSADRSFHRNQDRLARLQAQRPPAPPEPQPETETATQPAEKQPDKAELGSNPDFDPTTGMLRRAVPRSAHPDPKYCPHCSRLGFIGSNCTYTLRPETS